MHASVRISIQEVRKRRSKVYLRNEPIQHAVNLRRRRLGRIERTSRIVQRDRLAAIPELAVAKVTVPLDVKPVRSPQGDVFSCGELQLLAGWQHMIEVDIGMEGELVRRADVVAHLPE